MQRQRKFLSVLSLITVLSLLLVSCAGNESAPDDGQTSPAAEVQEPGDSEDSEAPAVEINTSGTEFEEAPLPEDFPESFPIPEEARIGSSVNDPGVEGFRTMLALTNTPDEALAYYLGALPAEGWEIIDQTDSEYGTYLIIRSADYEGELLFISLDTGVIVDVGLYPVGAKKEIPESEMDLGTSADLGETETEIPANFPLPDGASPIILPEKLKNEGYQLAFEIQDLPEMIIIQLSIAVMSAGWELGEYIVNAETHSFLIPFEDPVSGFEGYALLTDNPGLVGLDSVSGSIFALHPGVLE
jgi:hypothetical protein